MSASPGPRDPPADAPPGGGAAATRTWVVVAAFFEGPDARWLDDFIARDGLAFRKQPPPAAVASWHGGRGRRTGAGAWLSHLRQARRAMRGRPDGIIACFPPLAMCAALLKRLGRHKPRIIAYNYNLGSLPGGLRRRLARAVAPQIDRYVVHAPSEVGPYAAYLGIPRDRVRFVPLQRGTIEQARDEDEAAPFALAMGSAHRDYATLVAAVDALAVPTVIVTRRADADALPASPHVTLRSDLSAQDCMDLLARARLSVTPISNLETASGQVTILDAMQLGVPVVATRCPGTDGYVEDGRTGLLVAPFDADALRAAIAALWNDPDRRRALSEAARAVARTRFSDAAAAAALEALIGELDAGAG